MGAIEGLSLHHTLYFHESSFTGFKESHHAIFEVKAAPLGNNLLLLGQVNIHISITAMSVHKPFPCQDFILVGLMCSHDVSASEDDVLLHGSKQPNNVCDEL